MPPVGLLTPPNREFSTNQRCSRGKFSGEVTVECLDACQFFPISSAIRRRGTGSWAWSARRRLFKTETSNVRDEGRTALALGREANGQVGSFGRWRFLLVIIHIVCGQS